jgi:hypothetical protein
VHHLCALRPVAGEAGERGAVVARRLARCGTAISDACAEFAAGALPPDVAAAAGTSGAGNINHGLTNHPQEAAMRLGELMVTCVLSRAERGVVDSALDYFININTVPVASRAPAMRADIYASVLPVLLRQVVPAGRLCE